MTSGAASTHPIRSPAPRIFEKDETDTTTPPVCFKRKHTLKDGAGRQTLQGCKWQQSNATADWLCYLRPLERGGGRCSPMPSVQLNCKDPDRHGAPSQSQGTPVPR